MGALSSLSFLNPWVLSGLLFLPALWYLLKVTPPAPRHIFFPATRFLAGLKPEDQTPSKTPWWILLLRLCLVALLIIALARPVMNAGDSLPGSGPLRLVIDNGWEAAQTWDLQIKTAETILEQAKRERRALYILTTAPEPGKDTPQQQGPLTAGQAIATLRGLVPQPWPSNYEAANTLAKNGKIKGSVFSIWLSSGVAGKSHGSLVRTLQNNGSLRFIEPDKSQLPLLLSPSKGVGAGIKVKISAPPTLEKGTPVLIQTHGANGRLLDAQRVTLNSETLSQSITLDLPENLRNLINHISIAGRKGAGSLLIIDDQNKRRLVGILAPEGEAEKAPFIEGSYYLTRALEPYADLYTGTLDILLEKQPSVIILPDIGALTSQELNNLENWIKEGGLLLRFAGPNMTRGDNFLTPVPLLKGERALDGSLTWTEPVRLAPFLENSPFYGIDIQEDIKVKRQMLAEPAADIEKKTWATLEDGTPLITANNVGNGLLVLIHTTATPEWSSLPLSGIYVQILRRIINLSPGSVLQETQSGALQPVLTINGYGEQIQPPDYVLPIQAKDFDAQIPNPKHPPGLYGRTGYQRALNLGDRLTMPPAITDIPVGVEHFPYNNDHETDLLPLFFSLALCLFLLDWSIMVLLQTTGHRGYSRFLKRTAPLVLVFSALLCFTPAYKAQAAEFNPAYANDLYLAYVTTPDPQVNRTTQKGLEVLAKILTQRTSVEPAGVAAINPEKDELSFFPFIYWPITGNDKKLSDAALEKVQYYIDHGGTILIDTRDQSSSPRGTSGIGGVNQPALRTMMGSLNIPPLVPMEDTHVLTKSFYLLPDGLPGRYRGGTLWVEDQSTPGKGGVSSLIIGGHDWAAAWATGEAYNTTLSGGPRQQEMALRAGVNFMIYALTGNYKSDQVHLPHILERLGQ